MRTIFLLILITGLFSCTRTKESLNSDVAIDSLESSPQDDYVASTIYRSLDSDSLLIDKKTVDEFLLNFIINGKLIRKHEYGGRDCDSAYKTYKLDNNTSILTIDKYDCGDYGFGNSQYLTSGDSITYVREFAVEWDATNDKTSYKVTERLIKFKNGRTQLKERQKSIDRLTDLRFGNLQFRDIEQLTNDEYSRIRKELIDKGRIES